MLYSNCMKMFRLTGVEVPGDPFDLIVLVLASDQKLFLFSLYLHVVKVPSTLIPCKDRGLGHFKACCSFLLIFNHLLCFEIQEEDIRLSFKILVEHVCSRMCHVETFQHYTHFRFLI